MTDEQLQAEWLKTNQPKQYKLPPRDKLSSRELQQIIDSRLAEVKSLKQHNYIEHESRADWLTFDYDESVRFYGNSWRNHANESTVATAQHAIINGYWHSHCFKFIILRDGILFHYVANLWKDKSFI